MKDLSLLTWFTQLGLSVAIPPIALILLAVWLRNQFGWGQWILWIAILLSLYCAVSGFVNSVRQLSRVAKENKQETTVSFNEHD